MSHNTMVQNVKITDIGALQTAVDNLAQRGFRISLTQNSHYRGYDSRQSGIRPYVINLPSSPYDIALVNNDDGSYAIQLDAFAGHIRKAVGTPADAVCLTDAKHTPEQLAVGTLMQEYTAVKLYNEAVARGYAVQRDFDEATQQTRLLVTNIA